MDFADESPFASIVLKEKKETLQRKQAKDAPPQRKKDSEIVQGFDRNASFADILYNWEHLGTPYAMPEKKKQKEIRESKTDFATIFEQWENGLSSGKKKAPEPTKRVSPKYVPTKSFGDILDSYEGVKPTPKPAPTPAQAKKKEATPYKRVSELYKPTQSFGDILSSFEGEKPNGKPKQRPEAEKKKKGQAPCKRVSGEYRPTQDFGTILDSFEGVGKAPIEEKREAIETVVEVKVETKAEVVESLPTSSLFKKMEEDDERSPEAAWSVFGDNKPIERPIAEEKKPEPIKGKEQKASKRASKAYKPTKDFGAILKDFEDGIVTEVSETLIVQAQAEEPKVAVSTLFKGENEVEKRSAVATWSVYGNNKAIDRPKATVAAGVKNAQKASVMHDPDPIKSDLFKEAMREEPVKSFEDILREKGIDTKPKAFTIQKLRSMLPQASIDLHGMTLSEAESELPSFLCECFEHGLEKVSVIHGKGLHSEDGSSVLKEYVDSFVDGSELIREHYNPSSAQGGDGVTWIILKKKNAGSQRSL